MTKSLEVDMRAQLAENNSEEFMEPAGTLTDTNQRFERFYSRCSAAFHFVAAFIRALISFLMFQNPLQVERRTLRLHKEFKDLAPYYDELSGNWAGKWELRDRFKNRLQAAQKNQRTIEELKGKLYRANFLNHSRLLMEFNRLFQENTYLVDEIKFLLRLKDSPSRLGMKAENILKLIEKNESRIAAFEKPSSSIDPLTYLFRSTWMSGKIKGIKDENRYLFRRFCYLTRNH